MFRSGGFRALLAAVLVGTAAWLSLSAVAPARDTSAVEFRRGIGVGTMAWAAIGADGQFVFPPFGEPWHRLTVDELQTLRRTGFDFIRLAVDPGPFLQLQGMRRDVLDKILLERVNLIRAAGLSVIVDFHPSDMQPAYTAQKLTAGLDTPLFQAYLQLLSRTAVLLDRLHSRNVALELMNEPPVRANVWQPMLDAAYAAVRDRSAELSVVIDGGEYASFEDLMAIPVDALARDPAVILSFHYYAALAFTHQGASWWREGRYFADVPYPAQARPLDDSLEATAAVIEKSDLSTEQKMLAYRNAQMRLESYRRSAFGRSTIAEAFARVADWARGHGIAAHRILLGEFGARKTELQNSGARLAERTQWFRDVREAAEAHGFSWTAFAYRGGGFALARSASENDIDPAIAQALGLNVRPQTKAAAAR